MRFRTFLTTMVLVIGLFCTVSAQSQEATPSVVPGDKESKLTVYLEDVVGGSLYLKNLIAAQEMWFALPPNWSIEAPVDVKLIYTVSKLLNEGRSSVSISVNGQNFLSFVPEVGNEQEEHEISFQIPPDLIVNEKGILIEIEGYLSVTTDVCEITASPAQWLMVSKKSSVSLMPDTTPDPPLLEDLAENLLGTSPFVADVPLLFVLPDNPSETVLSTTALFVQRLGYEGNTNRKLIVRRVSSITPEELAKSNVVVIGLPTEQPFIEPIVQKISYNAFVDGAFVTPDNVAVSEIDGVLHLVNSPWNELHNALLISANGETGLTNVGQMFRKTRVYQTLNGSYKFVSAESLSAMTQLENAALTPEATPEAPSGDQPNEAEKLQASVKNRPWQGDTIDLKQIDIATTTVSGLGLTSFFWDLQRPPGWLLREGANINLNIGTSYLEPGSYVSVFVDNVFVGTVDTSADWQVQQTFDLPVEQINTIWGEYPGDDAVLRLDVSNVWRFNTCEQIDDGSIWTQIDDTSTITLPHTYLPLPSLRAFPYPFTHIDLPYPTVIVLPDNPQDYEIELALRLATQIGRGSFGEADIQLLQSRQVINLTTNNHLILLGEGDTNPLLNEMKALIAQETETPLYEALSDGGHVGLIREEIAPWNEENVVMLINGNSPESLSFAVSSLSPENPLLDDVRIMEDTDSTRVLRQ